MKTIIKFCVSCVSFCLILATWFQTSILVTPFNPRIPEEIEVNKITEFFKIQTTLAQEIVEISKEEGLPPALIAALIFTESSFRPNAISSKNYYGLTQIPWRIPYQDINIRLGIRILKEKLRITDGDLPKAIQLYKGYQLEDPRGQEQARKVIRLMKQLETYK